MEPGVKAKSVAVGFKRIPRTVLLLVAMFVIAPDIVFGGGGILTSPHNLSVSGGTGSNFVSLPEERVCVFCHAPHNAQTSLPLWNRPLSSQNYTPYDSSTLKVTPKPNQPTGASRLCLSCHDGTVALGRFGGSQISGGGSTMPTNPDPVKNPNLTSDLRDDHPISFSYLNAASANTELVSSAALPVEVKLEDGNYLQCTSCHDPHNNANGKFLVIGNNTPSSPLCTACHVPAGWEGCTHNPANTPSLTQGCMSCHIVHTAPVPEHLLNGPSGTFNCTDACHNGVAGGASANIKSVVVGDRTKLAFIPSGASSDARLSRTRHIHECVDCHNSHQVSRNPAGAQLSGSLKGVKGLSRNTLAPVVASAEYEVCFRCHSGSYLANFRGVSIATYNRMVSEPDQIKRFDSSRTSSFHPVLDQRRGNGASLLAQFQANMIRISCGDCHNSDQSVIAGGTGPNGPHGSRWEHLLLAQYEMPPAAIPQTRLPYNASYYSLCFRCHDENFITGSSSGFVRNTAGVRNLHLPHIQDQRIPCFACHDPHGVPGTPGSASSHLINFDRGYAGSASTYTATSQGGSCLVSCHPRGISYTR